MRSGENEDLGLKKTPRNTPFVEKPCQILSKLKMRRVQLEGVNCIQKLNPKVSRFNISLLSNNSPLIAL